MSYEQSNHHWVAPHTAEADMGDGFMYMPFNCHEEIVRQALFFNDRLERLAQVARNHKLEERKWKILDENRCQVVYAITEAYAQCAEYRGKDANGKSIMACKGTCLGYFNVWRRVYNTIDCPDE